MNWKSIKKQLPERGQEVLVAILCRPINVPASYTLKFATLSESNYRDSADSTGDAWKMSYGGRVSYWPIDFVTHWTEIPDFPKIKYDKDPKECKHKFEENIDNRFCGSCGLQQTLREAKKRWESRV